MDKKTPDARSRIMSSVRNKDTEPERAARRALHAAGFRFRLHRKDLPGTPDIVLPKYRVVVMVHGCFWHGHDCPRGKRPVTNADFWAQKIDGNMRRDMANAISLAKLEWTVLTVWACRISKDVDSIIERLRKSDCAPRLTA